jgi:hypothetical protein
VSGEEPHNVQGPATAVTAAACAHPSSLLALSFCFRYSVSVNSNDSTASMHSTALHVTCGLSSPPTRMKD